MLRWRGIGATGEMMLSVMMKFALVITTIAPVGLTLAFLIFKVEKDIFKAVSFGVGSLILCGICVEIIVASSKKLNKTKISVSTIKPADKEISGYFVAYMLPILGGGAYFVETTTFLFFAAMFFIFIWASKSFYANPVLAICGYKFFEIQLTHGGSLLLISRKQIMNPSEVSEVRYITSHTVIDANKVE